jgi:S1-C subfamily serine protease
MTTAALTDFSNALAALAERAGRSVVSIRSGRWRSSGFAWRPSLIVAADETLADDDSAEVTLPGGARAAAEVVGRDPATDVALLRLGGVELPPLALDAAALRAGALVMVVGGREGSPVAAFGAVGFVGPAWSSLRGGRIDARIELDASLRGPREGGVVLDSEGRGIGMAVRGPRGRTLVIPSATIERAATLLESHGRIPRGYLGVALEAVRVEGDRRGLMVMRVDADSPAAQAGVLQGDVIVGFDGHGLDGARGLLHALGPDSLGRTLTLSLLRAGAPIEASVTIGERPAG